MLRIRPEQWEVFSRAQRARFEEEDAFAHVAKHWPAVLAAAGEAGVRALIARVSSRADELAIDAEYDVLRLLNLHCAYGPEVEAQQPWIAKLLAEKHRPGRDRLDEVMARATSEPSSGAAEL
ncbi:MAG: hypothetical protein JNM84_02890 [Planctomycetes bacterium]|nr:hypothetical protein [Planctomycetota bacterium]